MEHTHRKSTEFEQEVFRFLHDLQESAVVNMFGAAPYIREEFGVDKKTSRMLLVLWTKNYNKKGNYKTIKNLYSSDEIGFTNRTEIKEIN